MLIRKHQADIYNKHFAVAHHVIVSTRLQSLAILPVFTETCRAKYLHNVPYLYDSQKEKNVQRPCVTVHET